MYYNNRLVISKIIIIAIFLFLFFFLFPLFISQILLYRCKINIATYIFTSHVISLNNFLIIFK